MIYRFPQVVASYLQLTSGSFVSGVYAPAYDTGIPITIVQPQPVRADDLAMLPEGERVSDYLKTWTAQTCLPGDLLTVGATVYKIVQVDTRDEIGADFCRVIIRQKKADEA